MGHLHLTARDGAEGRKFWAAMGGATVQNGTLQLIQFPGTFVMIRQANRLPARRARRLTT
jgi:hypothetical protein